MRAALASTILAGGLVAAGTASATPAFDVDFGTLSNISVSTSDTLGTAPGPGGGTVSDVFWLRFEIGAVDFLDIDTNGSGVDTMIGLYDAAGVLIAEDDDDGVDLASVLSFGTGSGATLGDSFNLGGDGAANGEDGGLGPGTYYLAVGRFFTDFGSTGFSVTPSEYNPEGEVDESIIVTVSTGAAATPVPLPAAGWLLLAGAGGLATLRGRRRPG